MSSAPFTFHGQRPRPLTLVPDPAPEPPRREKMSVKDTAAALRKALRERWPGVKFSVTMSRGTGYGWFDARWTDGPTEEAFRKVADGFQDERFDGMIDGYVSIPGRVYNCSGVTAQRRYSPEAQEHARRVYDRNPGLYERPGDWPEADGTNPQAYRRILYTLDLSDGIPEDAS